jgi:tripartite-type tricarboxylate transporter receptor subunit TctC
MKELVDLAKSRPGQLNYASSGVASTPQLAVELLKSITNINLTHVPYKGSGPALVDLFSGQVHLMVTGITSLLPSVKAGKLRALSVADTKRSPLMPDVPTAIEAGIPGFTASVWTGLLAPAKTPASIIALLNRETVRILQSQEIKDRFLGLGADPIGNQASEFEAYMREELQKWGKVVKSLGLNENNVDF